MLHFVLCDDNPRHNQTLSHHLSALAPTLSMESELTLVTTNPREVIDYALHAKQPTVYLLDLVLEGEDMNGLDVCSVIRTRDPNAHIIYVSAYAEYAMDCVQSHAFDFVLKPYTPERLANALNDVIQDVSRRIPDMPLTVTAGSLTRMMDQRDILYIQVQREYVTAHLADGQFTWRESMLQLMRRLNSEWFIRIHKSCAVNRLHIASIDQKALEVTLKNGVILPVSRRMARALQKNL